MGIARSINSKLMGNRITFLSMIPFPADVDKLLEGDGPKWVQISEEGDYPGYRNGEQPMAITKVMFEQIVRNLHANPNYMADENGVGCARVVPWDFHHASEMWPADGVIPTIGAPAQAWTWELEVRESTEGTAQLWGLTEFLEPARGYVREGKYQWASASIAFNVIDPATAKRIGAVLTSVALTNQPVVQGMEKLAASNGINPRGYWLDNADRLERPLMMLKDVLRLPVTSTIADLTGEIAKLKQAMTDEGAEPGMALGDVIDQMRYIFNLPTLATDEEVIAEADKLITSLVQRQAGQQAPDNEGATTAGAAIAKDEEMELLKALASRLGVREADAAVETAVGDLTTFQAGIKKLLGTESDSANVLLEGVERSVKARAKLTALLKALGVEDADSAVNRVAEMLAQAKELAQVMPELASLKAKVQAQEAEQAIADVDAVVASRGYDPSIKDALLMLRTSDPAKFAANYPAPKPGDAKLLSTIIVAPHAKPMAAKSADLPAAVNLAMYPGENITARAMSYILSTVPGSDKWTHEQVFVAACQLKKQPNVIDQA